MENVFSFPLYGKMPLGCKVYFYPRRQCDTHEFIFIFQVTWRTIVQTKYLFLTLIKHNLLVSQP
jgi:hypothetical protein